MYATANDIAKQIFEDELIRLTDESGTGAIDTTKVETAIETAEVEVDAYLGEKYSLPLDSIPGILTKLTVDLAIKNLYLLAPGGVPDDRSEQAKVAVRMLEKISEGSLTLGASDPQGDDTDNAVLVGSPGRIFSRDKMRGF